MKVVSSGNNLIRKTSTMPFPIYFLPKKLNITLLREQSFLEINFPLPLQGNFDMTEPKLSSCRCQSMHFKHHSLRKSLMGCDATNLYSSQKFKYAWRGLFLLLVKFSSCKFFK